MDDGLMLLKRLISFGAGPPIVCAGSTHRDLVERGARDLRIAPHRLVGTAPEALAAAVRALVALEANESPRDVAVTVLGVPPSHIVVPWHEATIAGLTLVSILEQPVVRRLAARVPSLWPPGPYSLAVVAAEAIACILGRSHRIMSCFVAPDDSAGTRRRAAALPVRLGAAGVISAAVPSLDVHDRVALENAMLL